MEVRALTWNLFHGRDHPPEPGLLTWRSRLLRNDRARNATHAQVNRDLLDEFAAVLAGGRLGRRAAAGVPAALGGAARPRDRRRGAPRPDDPATRPAWRAPALIADLNPDLIGSERGRLEPDARPRPAPTPSAASSRLATRPERRVMAFTRAVRVDRPRARDREPARERGPARAPRRSARSARRDARDWAGDAPLLFGGDLNLRPRESRTSSTRLATGPGWPRPTGAGLARPPARRRPRDRRADLRGRLAGEPPRGRGRGAARSGSPTTRPSRRTFA